MRLPLLPFINVQRNVSTKIHWKLLFATMIFVAAPVFIAWGDVVTGEMLFERCRGVHTIEQGERTG